MNTTYPSSLSHKNLQFKTYGWYGMHLGAIATCQMTAAETSGKVSQVKWHREKSQLLFISDTDTETHPGKGHKFGN